MTQILPKDEWPICRSCGDIIPPQDGVFYKAYNHRKRKTCGKEECLTNIARYNGSLSGGTKGNAFRKKAEVQQPEKKKRRSFAEEHKLDMEQARLNIKIAKDLAARCGYHHGPVKVLTPEEIAEVKVTPLEEIPKVRRFVLTIN